MGMGKNRIINLIILNNINTKGNNRKGVGYFISHYNIFRFFFFLFTTNACFHVNNLIP